MIFEIHSASHSAEFPAWTAVAGGLLLISSPLFSIYLKEKKERGVVTRNAAE
jgi:hypothetical protein